VGDQPVHRAQQGRLPRPGAADHEAELALGDRQVDAPQDRRPGVGEPEGHLLQLDHAAAPSGRPSTVPRATRRGGGGATTAGASATRIPRVATTGPGGGAAALQVDPGGTKWIKFKALQPGLYVYHCATPMVAQHIANGMYGMILIEPEGGLPKVDHEFYVMQGEIYTDAAFGQQGSHAVSVEKLLNERPEYFVFNGSVGALSKLHPLQAKVGDTVRIFFGVGGPNYTSSFHVIGEIFDRVYNLGDLQTAPARGVQTVSVPAGGATVIEFQLEVPGNYILVDHALSRAERGLVGILQVEGEPRPEIFDGRVEPGSGH
jgi:nitrite reductase (NO-forming)